MSASDTASPSRPIRSHTMSSPDINQFPAFSSVPDGRGRVRHQTLGVHDLKKMLDKSRTEELFANIPVDEKEIKRLPRKLWSYYEKLSTIHDHYEEVDGILSSGLPNAIATSFKPAQSTYSQSLNTWEQAEHRYHPGGLRRTLSTHSRVQSVHDGEENGDAHGEDEELLPSSASKEAARDKTARFALNVNFVINIVLLVSKGLAVLSSSSISLVASFVDSALDFLSTLIILGTSLAMGRKSERHHYPAGKRRFEPLGVLIFSVAMIASFVQVFIESFQRTIHPGEGEIAELSWIGIGTMVGTIVIKSIVWVWCSRMPSSAVRALAQDAENDVVFNAMSLAFPFLGAKLGWRLLDPIGGMVLSSYIIFEWCKTLYENFVNLSGKGASADEITRVLYLCTRLRPVREIASVECYHVGDELIVEVDIILPVTSSLHYAHDVAETAQCLIEGLDHVARAYVHCDYSSENPSQHTARNGPKKSPRGSSHQSDEQVVQSPPAINGGEQGNTDYVNSRKQEIRLN